MFAIKKKWERSISSMWLQAFPTITHIFNFWVALFFFEEVHFIWEHLAFIWIFFLSLSFLGFSSRFGCLLLSRETGEHILNVCSVVAVLPACLSIPGAVSWKRSFLYIQSSVRNKKPVSWHDEAKWVAIRHSGFKIHHLSMSCWLLQSWHGQLSSRSNTVFFVWGYHVVNR